MMEVWQDHDYNGWAFYPKNKEEMNQIKTTCRELLGKSHGENSMWFVAHKFPSEQRLILGTMVIKIVVVRDYDTATMLRLTWQ